MMDTSVPWFLDRLKGVRTVGSGWQVRCPSHPDKNPSLQIDRGGKGWLLYCHKGCSFSEIMGALGLPNNAAFYDYDAPADPSVLDADRAALDFFGPADKAWCRRSHTLEDVAWDTWPVEAANLARANAETHPYSSLRFEDAMRMWGTSGEVWFGHWMSERWMMNGGWHKIGWRDWKRWMHDQMWKAYLSQGCSDSRCEGNPSPAPALTAQEYLRRTTLGSTPSGSRR